MQTKKIHMYTTVPTYLVAQNIHGPHFTTHLRFNINYCTLIKNLDQCAPIPLQRLEHIYGKVDFI